VPAGLLESPEFLRFELTVAVQESQTQHEFVQQLQRDSGTVPRVGFVFHDHVGVLAGLKRLLAAVKASARRDE